MLEDDIPLLNQANPSSSAGTAYSARSLTPYIPSATPAPESVTVICGDSTRISVDRCFDLVNGVPHYYHFCGSETHISTVCTTPDGRIWQFTQMDVAPDSAHAHALAPQGYIPPSPNIEVRFFGHQPSALQVIHGMNASLAVIIPLIGMLWWGLCASPDTQERAPELTERQRQIVNGYYKETQKLLSQLAPRVTVLLPGETLLEASVGRYSDQPLHAWQSNERSKLPYMLRLYTKRQQSLFLLVDDLLDFEMRLADMLDESEGTQEDYDEIKSNFQALLKKARIFMHEHSQRRQLTESEHAKLTEYFNITQDKLRHLQQSSPIYLKEMTSPYDKDQKLYVRGFYELCLVNSLSSIEKLEPGTVYLETDRENNVKYAVINPSHEKTEGLLGKLSGKLTEAGLRQPKLRSDILNHLCGKELILRGNDDDGQTQTTESLAPIITEINRLIDIQHQYAEYLQTRCATNAELRRVEHLLRVTIAHFPGPSFMGNSASSSTFFSLPASGNAVPPPSVASRQISPSLSASSLPHIRNFFRDPPKGPTCSSRDRSNVVPNTSGNATNTPDPAASKSPDFQA